jgi:hypothetical protein
MYSTLLNPMNSAAEQEGSAPSVSYTLDSQPLEHRTQLALPKYIKMLFHLFVGSPHGRFRTFLVNILYAFLVTTSKLHAH